MNGIRLFGIIAADAGSGTNGAQSIPGISHVAFRDLAAIVAESDYSAEPDTETTLALHRRVVDGCFDTQTIVPAPPGVVFRSREMLARWLELHYFTLSDAMGFVDGRVGARVHAVPAAEDRAAGEDTAELTTDLSVRANERFRALRRHAVASLTIRPNGGTAAAITAAFLVERDRWSQFTAAVNEASRTDATLALTVTGPWPPYDFVRMQFSS